MTGDHISISNYLVSRRWLTRF